MTDQVLLSAGRHNIDECIALADEYHLGIEVMAFAYPDVLDGDWQSLLGEYRQKLAGIRGKLTTHGPFMDMVSGSPDARINQVCLERYRHAIEITAELGAELMVVHANFIGTIHNESYREIWHERNVPFWQGIAEHAERHGVITAIENMWEFDPTIISNLLAAVDHPYLRACIDIGHAHLYSNVEFTLSDWLRTLSPWLVHSHMNNNNGKVDVHHAFDYPDGVLNYHEVLKQIRALSNPPAIVLEMDRVEDMRASLSYLILDETNENAPG